jgi:hypothetical protein
LFPWNHWKKRANLLASGNLKSSEHPKAEFSAENTKKWIQLMSSPEIKEKLKKSTDEAVEKGCNFSFVFDSTRSFRCTYLLCN